MYRYRLIVPIGGPSADRRPSVAIRGPKRRQEALYTDSRRPSVTVRGPKRRQEALYTDSRRPSVMIRGPKCRQEALCTDIVAGPL